MLRKLKFYFLGLIPGVLIVFFVLNQKGTRCSGYLPSSRVVEEVLTKKFTYSPECQAEMKAQNISEKFLRDSLLLKGTVDFDLSHAQAKPCPDYFLKSKKFAVKFIKCKEQAIFTEIKKLP